MAVASETAAGIAGTPSRSSTINKTALTIPIPIPLSLAVTITIPVSSEAQTVAILVQRTVSVVATIVPAHVFAWLSSKLLPLAASSIFVDVDLAIFKIIPLLDLYLIVIGLLVVLLPKVAVHSRESLAGHLDFADRPDG